MRRSPYTLNRSASTPCFLASGCRQMKYGRSVRRCLSTILAAGLLYMSGIAGSVGQPASRAQPRPIKVLLLGDDREPHPAAAFYSLLAPVLGRRGIQITPALAPGAVLDAGRLAHYDAVMLYGDAASPAPEQAPALVAFVEGGKGLVAMHSASSMFPSSQSFAALIGGRMQAAGGGGVPGEIVQQGHHPVKGW